MVKIKELIHYTQQLMQVDCFQDYCPNGLQVEGRSSVSKIVTGVSASMALLKAAQQVEADLILVHHGYFWRNEDPSVIGIKRNRIAFLLKHDINLMVYHLPLDAHPEFGNNVQLGKVLGIEVIGYAGPANIVMHGRLSQPVNLIDFSKSIGKLLRRAPLIIGDPEQRVETVAWCTGAAQGYMNIAIDLGVDVFISGEISEQTTHQAMESGVSYVAAGHHATERYGIKALGEHLAFKFNLQHNFVDISNPV